MTQVQDKTDAVSIDVSKSKDLVSVDDSEADEFAEKATEKVQLDVEDALFLLEEMEESDAIVEIEEQKSSSKKEKEVEAPQKSKKKLIILISIPVLLIISVVTFFILKPAPIPEYVPEPITIVVPTPQKFTNVNGFEVKLSPFWIPTETAEGGSSFLVISFVLVAADAGLEQEIIAKSVIVRENIHYFLETTDPGYLLDYKNTAQIKEQVLDAVNNVLVRGKVSNVFFDSYVSR